jgi:hypothetical protein
MITVLMLIDRSSARGDRYEFDGWSSWWISGIADYQ